MSPARLIATVPTLTEVAAQPERINDLAPEAARALLVQLATLQAPLLARALAGGAAHGGEADELLTIDLAARRLGMSPAWLYRHAARLPFTRRVGRQVRFSARQLESYIANRATGQQRPA